MHAAVKPAAHELYDGVAEIDDGAAGLWFDVFPFVRLRVDDLKAS